jgi:hypothetical protein
LQDSTKEEKKLEQIKQFEQILSKLSQFHAINTQKKLLEADYKVLGNEIKSFMKEKDLTKLSGLGVTASYTYKERTKLDEQKVIQFLKEKGFTQAIKVVEQVDTTAVADLIYEEKITADELKPFMVPDTPYERLVVKGDKK